MLGIVLIFYWSGCGSKDETSEPPEYPVSIEEIEGIKIIRNPDFPREGIVRYELVAELSIGGPEAEGDSILVRPIEFQLDDYGNIYILDWREVGIKVFDSTGHFLRTVGRKGQGPGEFGVPAYFQIVGDKIYLLDSRNRKFSLLNLEGKYLQGFPLEGFSPGLGVTEDGTLYYSRMLNPEVELSEEMKLIKNSFALYKTDPSGKERVKLGEFKERDTMRRSQRSPTGSMGTVSSMSREAYTTSWFPGPGNLIYLGYNRDYDIEVRDANWNVIMRFGREFTPIPHPLYKPDRGHPEFYPAFSDWKKFFDDKGNLWLQQYPDEEVEEYTFDVFSPEGIYLKKVLVPQSLKAVRQDKAYAFVRTEDDFIVFNRFRMVPVDTTQ